MRALFALVLVACSGTGRAEDAAVDGGRVDATIDGGIADSGVVDAGLDAADAGTHCPVSGLAPVLPFELANGAFPGSGHPDVTVHVPDGFDPCARHGAIVFFHGFDNCVVNVIGSSDGTCTSGGAVRSALHLSDQLDAARVNAILVAVELRFDQATSDPGALATDGRLHDLLDELYVDHLSVLFGRPTSLADVERVVLSSHSGGYVAVARCLQHGGVATIREVDLHDSLYGEIPTYTNWIESQLGRFDPAATQPLRFAVVYTDGGGTAANSRALGTELTSVAAPAQLLFDDTTATLAPPDFAHPLLVKHSMLSHDGVPRYYFERLAMAAGFAPL